MFELGLIFEIDLVHPDIHTFHREYHGQNEGNVIQRVWPLPRNSRTENNPDIVVDDVLSSYSTNSLDPTVSQQSANQIHQSNHLNSTEPTSFRRHTFRLGDSAIVPLHEFSESDDSFIRAHQHPFWKIEGRLWPNGDPETDIDVTSLSLQLLQFVYYGLGNDSQGATEMIRNSKLRWFHLPMNNVSINYPDICIQH